MRWLSYLPAFTFAHLALAAAEILARAAGDMVRLALTGLAPPSFPALIFAHRALAAALILALPAADILRCRRITPPTVNASGMPRRPVNSASSCSMRSLIATAFFNCATVKSLSVFAMSREVELERDLVKSPKILSANNVKMERN